MSFGLGVRAGFGSSEEFTLNSCVNQLPDPPPVLAGSDPESLDDLIPFSVLLSRDVVCLFCCLVVSRWIGAEFALCSRFWSHSFGMRQVELACFAEQATALR